MSLTVTLVDTRVATLPTVADKRRKDRPAPRTAPPRKCPKCHGSKQVPDPKNPKGPWKKCPQCDGKGYW